MLEDFDRRDTQWSRRFYATAKANSHRPSWLAYTPGHTFAFAEIDLYRNGAGLDNAQLQEKADQRWNSQ